MALGDFLYFGSTRLKNYISDNIEVGYSQYGPTLAFSGTITAFKSVVFINNISLLLFAKEQDTPRQFTWFAFRPHRFSLSGVKDIDLTMPSKFIVQPNSPYPYNIIFNDQLRYAEMNPSLKKIKIEWEMILKKNSHVFSNTDYTTLFNGFAQTDSAISIQNELQQLCYWLPGEYLLRIIIVPQNSKNLVEAEKKFFLSSQDTTQLSENAFAIIADLCHQPNAPYFFARPNLMPI